MDLEKNEKLQSAVAVGEAGALLSGAGRAGKPTEAALDLKTLKSFFTHRARKGHALEPKLKDAKLTAI
jgi:topoisomerase-4 subunit A